MAKSRHRKNHKEKVEARKNRLISDKSKNQKAQREFIMNLIKEEEAKGMFNNNPTLDNGVTPTIEGPMI
jgi:hypothetical protein